MGWKTELNRSAQSASPSRPVVNRERHAAVKQLQSFPTCRDVVKKKMW